MFDWSRAQWLKDSGEQIDPNRYPAQTATDLLSKSGAKIASTADWEKAAAGIRAAINGMLGENPGFYVAPAGGRGGRGPVLPGGPGGPNPGQLRPDVPAWVIQRGGNSFGWVEPGRSLAAMRPMNFGYGVTGHLYFPNNTPAGTRLPAVIWLHGYSYPLGYMWVYRSDPHPILALVNAGYAVLAFDQAGFGSRM